MLPGRDNVLAAKANYEKAVKWNLGLSVPEMKEVAGHGFMVVARPTNYVKVRAEDIEAVFDRLSAVDQVSTVMFVGEEALGYPGQLKLTMEKMRERDLTLGMIEHPLQLQFVKQEGLTALAALNGYKAARVYVIPKEEQPKLKLNEAVHRWAVTDLERNIRINMLRKFDKPEPGKTLLETNLDYVSGVRDQMTARGFADWQSWNFSTVFSQSVADDGGHCRRCGCRGFVFDAAASVCAAVSSHFVAGIDDFARGTGSERRWSAGFVRQRLWPVRFCSPYWR